MRAAASATAAAVIFVAVALLLTSAYLRISYESFRVIRELGSEVVISRSTPVWWSVEDGRVVLYSSSPVRAVAAVLVSGERVVVLRNDFTIDGSYVLEGVSASSGKVLLVLEGGGYLVIDLENPPSTMAGELAEELRTSTKLLPLLSRYLAPRDYLEVVGSYLVLNYSEYTLRPHYVPYVTHRRGGATHHCQHDLLYIHLTWDGEYWYATYRKCSPDGPVVNATRVARSATEIPYGEHLYHRECSAGSGVRYCFEVYVTTRGYCRYGCASPPSSWWYFDVGMRVVYRFESLVSGSYLLVVLNRTTFEAAVVRGPSTCVHYISIAGLWCYRCSNNPTVGVCGTGNIVSYLEGPRPVFMWDILYEEDYETHYRRDDGYEMGAWYPHIDVLPHLDYWRGSSHYSYAVSEEVSISLRVAGTRGEDYLARRETHQYGYYRVFFDLIYDGGSGADLRRWDYGVFVFLLKPSR